MLKTAEKYHRPDNVTNLVVPKTNTVVFKCLNKGPQVVDSALQKVTLLTLKGMIPIIDIVDRIGLNKKDPIELHLDKLSDSIRLLSAAVSYTGQARKDVIRNDLHGSVAGLCTWETSVGTTALFGEDVAKKLIESAKEYRLVNTMKKGHKGRGKFGYKNKSGYHGYKNKGFWKGASNKKRFKKNKYYKNKSNKD